MGTRKPATGTWKAISKRIMYIVKLKLNKSYVNFVRFYVTLQNKIMEIQK